MPPKKAPAPEKKALLGRPGNNLKIGIVGLFPLNPPTLDRSYRTRVGMPNVGKSSFFNVLSKTGKPLGRFTYAPDSPRNATKISERVPTTPTQP